MVAVTASGVIDALLSQSTGLRLHEKLPVILTEVRAAPQSADLDGLIEGEESSVTLDPWANGKRLLHVKIGWNAKAQNKISS